MNFGFMSFVKVNDFCVSTVASIIFLFFFYRNLQFWQCLWHCPISIGQASFDDLWIEPSSLAFRSPSFIENMNCPKNKNMKIWSWNPLDNLIFYAEAYLENSTIYNYAIYNLFQSLNLKHYRLVKGLFIEAKPFNRPNRQHLHTFLARFSARI